MNLRTQPFSYNFTPGTIHFGRTCIEKIGKELKAEGIETVVVVSGKNINENKRLMTHVEGALRKLDYMKFPKTTPEKLLKTAFEGSKMVIENDVDAVVAVGGGSTHDIAQVISVLAARDGKFDDIRSEVISGGLITMPSDTGKLLPVYSIPTTFAGADISIGGGTTIERNGRHIEGLVVNEELMPAGLFYDPNLFETTPDDILAASAMNGFNKGIEAVYSRNADPITDATAIYGLRYLTASLPDLRTYEMPEVMDRIVTGMILVQYGTSVREEYKFSVIHVFGHEIRYAFDIHQGLVHATVGPVILEWLLENDEEWETLLADGLTEGIHDPEEMVDTVIGIRDHLELPSRLGDVISMNDKEIRDISRNIKQNTFLEASPESFDPTVDEIETILRKAI